MTEELDQKLDDLLRQDFSGAVSDDGFTAHVMARLPTRVSRRSWLIPAAGTGGVLLTWLALLPSPLWQQVAREWLAAGIGPNSAFLLALVLGIGLLGSAWALEEAA